MPNAIRPCTDTDIPGILAVINDGAEAYRGIIPADRFHDPYMSEDHLRAEIAAGVRFSALNSAITAGGGLSGVMGIQDVKDVTLIRHAYVATAHQRHGIGGALLSALLDGTDRPVLIGTWAAAVWAIGFYEGHGFRQTDTPAKTRLLETYWSIPARQVETSVVLADARWWSEYS